MLLAGTKYRGDFEKRFKAVLKALSRQTGAIVFIDEIHNLVGAGSATGGTMDASNLIKPLLSSVNCAAWVQLLMKNIEIISPKIMPYYAVFKKLILPNPP